MWTLKNLSRYASETATEIDGKWVPARPLPGPWTWRIKDAWAVLTGRADAFVWPSNQ